MAERPPASPSLIHIPDSYIDPLPLDRLFESSAPLEVEIGAGDGSFIAVHAAAHPDRNFLAVERLLGRLRKIDKKGRRAGLRNLLLLRIEAAYFVRHLLPSEAAVAVHIYFPDPWPKRRHWKNRLITAEFAETLRLKLQPGGMVHLRTDNPDYYAQMLESFNPNSAYARVDTPPELLGVVTDFEREFHKRGIPTLHASYRRAG